MANYSNKDFGSDLKKAYKKSAKKTAKKKKIAMPSARVKPLFGGATQAGMNSAMANAKVIGAPARAGMAMPNNANPSWVKQKKNKNSKKMKVSHVEQKKSMCKMCKTSHAAGKHTAKKGSIKKKS